jgi:hypothetical protein
VLPPNFGSFAYSVSGQKQMMRKGEKNGSFLLGYCNKCFYCLNAFCLYYDIAGQFKKNGNRF